jgi:aspartate 1-decarboxylase
MWIEILKSKIHMVTVTEANLNYIGSIGIDEDLMDAANLVEGEKVQVLNVNNGERLETYVIKGIRGSGQITLNGPAARKFMVGDIIIIMSFAMIDFNEAKKFKSQIIFPDTNTNKLIK